MTTQTQSNVSNITDKQHAPGVKFTIHATLRGFPITIEGEGRAGDLKTIVDRLTDLGAEPPRVAQAIDEMVKGAQGDNAKKAPPKCPVHRSPMKESTGRKGGFYCPRKDDNGYCDETA